MPLSLREDAVPRSSSSQPPWPIEPMLAKPGKVPAHPEAFAYELKWDGYRTLLRAEGGKANVRTRNLRDVTSDYPEAQAIAKALADHRLILDGELVALDEKGRPSFGRMQQRAGAFGAGREGKDPSIGVVYIAFDLLWLDGKSLMGQPCSERRAALEALDLECPEAWVPPAHDEGASLLEAGAQLGLEGIVAKRRDSRYEAGKRTGAWVKIKNVLSQEFVIGGYSKGEGSRGELGALLLGYYDGDELRYAGKVGTGFTSVALRDLAAKLKPLSRKSKPFKGQVEAEGEIVFVEPRLVCEVNFASWTDDDHLRHPTYRGLRDDKDPADVVREDAREGEQEEDS